MKYRLLKELTVSKNHAILIADFETYCILKYSNIIDHRYSDNGIALKGIHKAILHIEDQEIVMPMTSSSMLLVEVLQDDNDDRLLSIEFHENILAYGIATDSMSPGIQYVLPGDSRLNNTIVCIKLIQHDSLSFDLYISYVQLSVYSDVVEAKNTTSYFDTGDIYIICKQSIAARLGEKRLNLIDVVNVENGFNLLEYCKLFTDDEDTQIFVRCINAKREENIDIVLEQGRVYIQKDSYEYNGEKYLTVGRAEHPYDTIGNFKAERFEPVEKEG